MPLQIVRVTPLRQNCTILSAQSEAGAPTKIVIVDPGGDAEEIMRCVGETHVEAILLTHGHFDHAGGVNHLKTCLARKVQPDVPVLGPHKDDEFLLKSIGRQIRLFLDEDAMVDTGPVVPDRYLEDGEILSLLGREIEVRHVPGHTPGHVVFVDHFDQLVITGDTLFRGVVGRSDFPYGNHAQLVDGIRGKILSLPGHFKVYPGHGLPTLVDDEARFNEFVR